MLMAWVLAWILLSGVFAWAGLRYSRGLAATLTAPMLLLSIISGVVVMKDLWGTCMPEKLELRRGEATLLKHHWREGQAIWMWVEWPEDKEPMCYMYPWSNEKADEIQAAVDKQAGDDREEGTEVMVEFNGGSPGEERGEERSRFEEILTGFFPYFYEEMAADNTVYAKPPQAPPLKPGAETAPHPWRR